jgi:hypothetical protein
MPCRRQAAQARQNEKDRERGFYSRPQHRQTVAPSVGLAQELGLMLAVTPTQMRPSATQRSSQLALCSWPALSTEVQMNFAGDAGAAEETGGA